MAKRFFIILVALNALLLLFVVMKKDLNVSEEAVTSFKQEGDLLDVVSETKILPKEIDRSLCGEVGPIEDLEVAQQVSKRLFARNMANEVFEKDVHVSTDYWVIIPPRASQKQARRLLKQLQLANIDSYIVTQGDYANAISLGLFTVKASAYGVKEKLTNSGFEVSVQEIERTQKRYWVEFSGDVKLVQNGLAGLNVDISNKSCKSR